MRIVLRKGAKNIYGPALKRAREQYLQNMAQVDLAELLTSMGLSMDRSAVSRIENQKRSLTDIELQYFVEALRINLPRLNELLIKGRGAIPMYDEFSDDREFQIRVAEDADEDPLY